MLNVVHQESSLRVGTVLRGSMNSARLQALARSQLVLWVEPYKGMKLFDEVASKIVAGDGGPGELLTQSLGYDGAGVTVAVADSGLNNGDEFSMHPDLLGRTPLSFITAICSMPRTNIPMGRTWRESWQATARPGKWMTTATYTGWG
jgi:hypothetical protein